MSQERREGRYYSSNGFAVAIVAVVRHKPDGTVGDWAAYIGGTDRNQRREDAIDWAARMGDKLYDKDAAYYFPDLPIELYRS